MYRVGPILIPVPAFSASLSHAGIGPVQGVRNGNEPIRGKECVMFEFVDTETGWRIFWGVDPLAEADEDEAAARAARLVETEEDVPFLVLTEAAGLRPMAV